MLRSFRFRGGIAGSRGTLSLGTSCTPEAWMHRRWMSGRKNLRNGTPLWKHPGCMKRREKPKQRSLLMRQRSSAYGFSQKFNTFRGFSTLYNFATKARRTIWRKAGNLLQNGESYGTLSESHFSGISPEEQEDMLVLSLYSSIRIRKREFYFSKGKQYFPIWDLAYWQDLYRNYGSVGKSHDPAQPLTGASFAETYAFCRVPMMVDVTAVEHCQVLFIDLERMLAERIEKKAGTPKFYTICFAFFSKKPGMVAAGILSLVKGIRSRVMNYLSSEALQQGKTCITIPFDRQQMADYLT